MLALLRTTDRLVAWFEKSIVLLMVVAIVVFPLAHIVLRVAGQGGITWQHSLVRILLLWLAFLGASLATAERRHITIDLTDRNISPATKASFNIAVQAVGAVVMGYLAWVAVVFIGIQRKMAENSFEIPAWDTYLIVRLTLSIIGLRLLLQCVQDLRSVEPDSSGGRARLAAHGLGLLCVAGLAALPSVLIRWQRELGGGIPVFDIPVWVSYLVIPVSLTVIAWRLVLLCLEDAQGLKSGDFEYLSGPDSEGRLY